MFFSALEIWKSFRSLMLRAHEFVSTMKLAPVRLTLRLKIEFN